MRPRRTKDIIILSLTALLIAGAGIEGFALQVPPAGGEEYHQRIKQAYQQMPTRIEDWVGTEHALSQGAITLLHPNVAASWEYANFVTQQRAQVLLVQCTDAREMFGHYPPACYPGQGWTMNRSEPREWKVGGIDIKGMEYEFSRSETDRQSSSIVVDDFMMLPDGSFIRDMANLRPLAFEWRFFGSGQMQMITDTSIPDEERKKIFSTLIGGYVPVIRAIQSGGSNPTK
ncbi:MAG TPA: exosortase-associated EpsI family protein [Tepidisphaeraceae bacterium]|jgi:hypothetical protein|nr:exosortase-associated EpsI family protein [Tepidisphaeraceae bacterium]